MSMYQSPIFDKGKTLGQNVDEMFNGVSELVKALNDDNAARAALSLFASGGTSGTVTVPLDTARYRLLIAVVAGEPVICALYNGSLAGRGASQSVTGTLARTSLEYSASGTLDALIAIL